MNEGQGQKRLHGYFAAAALIGVCCQTKFNSPVSPKLKFWINIIPGTVVSLILSMTSYYLSITVTFISWFSDFGISSELYVIGSHPLYLGY